MPTRLLWNVSGESVDWKAEAAFSFIVLLLLCCLVFPPSLRLHNSLSLFVLPSFFLKHSFLCCVFSPSSFPHLSSLWRRFGSERRFGARLWQSFTLIKRMVGSAVGAAQELFFFTLLCLVFAAVGMSSYFLSRHSVIIRGSSLWLHSYFRCLSCAGFVCKPEIDLLSVTQF